MSDLDRAREALLKAAVALLDADEAFHAAQLRTTPPKTIAAANSALRRASECVHKRAFTYALYARAAREEGEKHGK